MPDWFETLQDVSGALSGIPKGIEAGMAPFATWEGIRTKDLANDKTDIELRNLLAAQNAREGMDVPAYYLSQADAARTGFDSSTAKNNLDIFGYERSLGANQAMTQNPAIMAALQQYGPNSVEFRDAVNMTRGAYDPLATIAGADAMKIPEMQQRNRTAQAVEAMLMEKVPGVANVRMLNDGTFELTGKDGQVVRMPWQQALLAASTTAAPNDPYKATSNILKDQGAITKDNIAAYIAANNLVRQGAGSGGNAEANALTQQRIILDRMHTEVQRDIKALRDSVPGISDDAPKMQELLKKKADYEAAGRDILIQQQRRGAGFGAGPISPSTFGRPGAGRPAVAPTGGSSMTTVPTTPADAVALARGGAGGAGPGAAPAPAAPAGGGFNYNPPIADHPPDPGTVENRRAEGQGAFKSEIWNSLFPRQNEPFPSPSYESLFGVPHAMSPVTPSSAMGEVDPRTQQQVLQMLSQMSPQQLAYIAQLMQQGQVA